MSHLLRRSLLGCAVGALAAPLLARGPVAQEPAAPLGFAPLTETPSGWGMFEPSVSAGGARVAFSAAFDFTGENPEGNFEVYLVDVASGTFLQLTGTPFGVGNFVPRLTPAGDAVVFRSAWDFTGGNTQNKFQLFEVDVATRAVTQLTTNAEGLNVDDPALSGDGAFVVFRSNSNPTGQNADLSYELFRLRRDDLSVEQLTNNTGPAVLEPAVDGDGDRVVFRAAQNLDGSNPEANYEVWLWRAGAGAVAVTQTPAGVVNEQPAVDAAGARVAFLSRHDFTGAGTAGTQNVWVADLTGPQPTFHLASAPGPLSVLPPAISPDGRFVLYETQRDGLGLNPDGNRELFRYDVELGLLEQGTDTQGGVATTQLSARASVDYLAFAPDDSGVLATRNEHDLDGPNAGANLDLWLAGPAAPPPVEYGRGAGGAAGPPRLVATPAELGKGLVVSLDGALPGPSVGALLVGHQPVTIPSGLGGDLLVAPDLVLLFASTGGGAELAFQLGLDPGVAGKTVFLQAYVVDATTEFGVATTAGLEIRLGF